jgi:hypothetical protein
MWRLWGYSYYVYRYEGSTLRLRFLLRPLSIALLCCLPLVGCVQDVDLEVDGLGCGGHATLPWVFGWELPRRILRRLSGQLIQMDV